MTGQPNERSLLVMTLFVIYLCIKRVVLLCRLEEGVVAAEEALAGDRSGQ